MRRTWARLLTAASVVALASVVSTGTSTAIAAHRINYGFYKGLPAVYRVMTWIRAGETISAVPTNLVPKLAAEGGGTFGSCSAVSDPSCAFGKLHAKTKVAIIGDSFAGEWVPALNLLGREDNFEVIPFSRPDCNIAAAVVRAFSGTVDPACAAWRAQVITDINTMRPQPSLVVVSEARYWSWPDGSLVTDSQCAWAVRTMLASIRTTQKEVLFGEALTSNPPATCLLAHLAAATACADPVSKDVFTAVQAGVPGMVAGAGYPVGATVLMCGTTCPLIADDTLVHSDQSHVNKDFAALVANAVGELLGCGAYSTVSDAVTIRLLGPKNAAKKATCARLLESAGWP